MSDYGDFQHHLMPSGAECWYRDSDHSYFSEVQQKGSKWTGVQSARLTSPSTVGPILDLDKANRLMLWAARHPDAVGHRDRRAEAGTKLHVEVLEALATGESVPNLGDVDEEERGRAQGVIAAWLDLSPETIGSEIVVCSEEHGFAGRIDTLCKIDGKLTILDLKTGKFVGSGAHAQLAGYRVAANESGYGPIEDAQILQVFEDGTYKVWECKATDQQFLDALAVYRSGKTLDKQLRDQRKAVAA